MAEILIKHGAKVNAKTRNGITPLLNAVSFSGTECVRILRQSGADPDLAALDGMTPRALATKNRQWEIMKLMTTTK